ncbi:winged helix DNA-binding domain-containing protein [Actinomadura sp. HBU206391]|uniref:winged helix DNA-binding domain-containing protein n=1 Tax=Actinomadura sp. HBU206391 TaxID=2731692 RepID=UPI00164FE315|nr:winged helix DNA-binding domain-containing protein [Actinomadura sp. HBU206391]MBC6463524.1 winged helix DNA-binding domain-containing protein [Actinomadura sp. HBU206391]
MGSLTWPQALAWRMRRQFLDPMGDAPAVEITRRLAGVQAQVASAAGLAVAVRQVAPRDRDVGKALWDERTLLKTWAMRGTLHLLPGDEAGAYLALCATLRHWEKPSWQRAFGATPAELELIAAAAADALGDGSPRTREELTAEIVERTGSGRLAEVLGSGWGTLLKPLAWWGVLCHGPSRGNRVTFTAPAHHVLGWRGLPPAEEAAGTVIRAFLGAHGPATAEMFDAWLTRGTSRRKELRGWFATLGDELTVVEVEGVPMYVLTDHLAEMQAMEPSSAVRLLGGFDQYVLGAGTGASYVVPAEHRAKVSRQAGWISPVVVHGGRVAGVWAAKDGAIEVTAWEDVPGGPLAAETERLSALV